MSWTYPHSWKLAAPPERVFTALTDPAQLACWFAERVEVVPGEGGRFRFWGKHTLGTPVAEQANQRIETWDPGRSLGFSWTIGGVPTSVRIAIATEDAGSRLTLRHEVRGSVALRREQELIDDHWRLALGNLDAHLAGGASILLPEYGDPAPEVRLVIVIEAPPEVVFRALVDPEAVSEWFGSGKPAAIEARVGGQYHLGWKYQVGGRDVEGGPTRILELVANERLVLGWPDWRGDETVTGQQISFTLEPVAEGTRLVFVHSGFERPADIGDFPFGWRDLLGGLRRTALALAAAS